MIDALEAAVAVGAARALRTRAAVQLQKAAGSIAAAGDQFPCVVIRWPEAAMAGNLAAAFERLAAELEAGACDE